MGPGFDEEAIGKTLEVRLSVLVRCEVIMVLPWLIVHAVNQLFMSPSGGTWGS